MEVSRKRETLYYMSPACVHVSLASGAAKSTPPTRARQLHSHTGDEEAFSNMSKGHQVLGISRCFFQSSTLPELCGAVLSYMSLPIKHGPGKGLPLQANEQPLAGPPSATSMTQSALETKTKSNNRE